MLTNDDVQKVAEDVLPNILAGLRREIQEQALYQAKQEAQSMVSEKVREFLSAEVIPEIHKALVESKDGLVSIAPELASSIVGAMSAALTDSIKKKLESSWERKKVFEALLS